jgi:CRP-like cAMP-binding protein
MKIYEYEKNKQMIANIQIFQTLTNKHKELISQHFKTIHFDKGEIIFKQGDPANSFYIVSSGLVRVEIP